MNEESVRSVRSVRSGESVRSGTVSGDRNCNLPITCDIRAVNGVATEANETTGTTGTTEANGMTRSGKRRLGSIAEAIACAIYQHYQPKRSLLLITVNVYT